ncbi:hypothetical protein CSC70_02665 [Pseudoxanthomonas kalamensis DSM 18571]|uniref:hypothetical protein n=1 Tax=Pseudoxanthomonas kalamensis TaxID=289483 RepID=UPI00139111BA|nr:hypothetical protein [Pseudoxanthomonas kalamensis]KAF1712442.1 hypothetical protein CSC70_02665 [Pseudoxanthomonas kalamensis DSM 18571]
MVVMDATTLLLLFYPSAKPPIDETTKQPLEKCRERIELRLQNLSEASIQILVPTPVLSEILVTTGTDKARVLNEINNTYAFRIQPFDEMAAIEVAMLTDADLQSNKRLPKTETIAKVKYDRQIIAIAKVNGVKTIYSDDKGLTKVARANGITVIKASELPLPPEPPQADMFASVNLEGSDDE